MLNCIGYFDESGIDADSKVIVVAGYVSPCQEWRRFEINWRKVLAQAKPNPLPYYHTSDIEQPMPRGIYKGWTREQADRLTDRLAPLVRDHMKWGAGAYMLRKDWLGFFDSIRDTFHNKPHKIPYILLAKTCVESLLMSLDKKLPTGEKIAFFFESNQFSHHIKVAHSGLMKNPAYACRLGSTTIVNNAKKQDGFEGFQAADLFAWHYRRYTEQRKEHRVGPHHRILNDVIRRAFELRFIDRGSSAKTWESYLRNPFPIKLV